MLAPDIRLFRTGNVESQTRPRHGQLENGAWSMLETSHLNE